MWCTGFGLLLTGCLQHVFRCQCVFNPAVDRGSRVLHAVKSCIRKARNAAASVFLGQTAPDGSCGAWGWRGQLGQACTWLLFVLEVCNIPASHCLGPGGQLCVLLPLAWDELGFSALFCAGFGHRGRYRFNVNYQLSSNGFCTKRARGRMSYHIAVTDSLFFTSPF